MIGKGSTLSKAKSLPSKAAKSWQGQVCKDHRRNTTPYIAMCGNIQKRDMISILILTPTPLGFNFLKIKRKQWLDGKQERPEIIRHPSTYHFFALLLRVDSMCCHVTWLALFSTPASDGFSQCCLWRWFFVDPTFVNWLSWWSSNYTIQHLRWSVMIRHLWWFALSTFHEESARAVSTWYLQAGALNPEDRRRTNGPTMACFGRDQVLRIIKSCVLKPDTFILCRIGCHQEYLGGNEHFGLRSMSPRTIQCLGCSREWWVFKGGASEFEIKVIP